MLPVVLVSLYVKLYQCKKKPSSALAQHVREPLGITPSRYTVKPFEKYMQHLQTSTCIEIHSLIGQDCNSLQMEEAAGQYLEYDEVAADPSILASIISTTS